MTKERIVELRRHLRLDDDIEPNIGAALTECLDEIERLQKRVDHDAGARALWDAHFGDHTPQPKSTLTVARTGSPDESLGWTEVVFTTGEKP